MPSSSRPPHALLVEDESLLLDSLVMSLKRAGSLRISKASCAEEALSLIERDPPDVVVTDVMMPGIGGLGLLERLRARNPALPVVVISAYGSSIRRQALRQGASAFLEKPFQVAELRGVLQSLLVKRGSLLPTRDDAGFEGQLESLALQDVIQVTCLTKARARVEVVSGAQRGELQVDGNNVVHGRFAGREGFDAVRAMARLTRGRFRVVEAGPAEKKTISLPWPELLMECARLDDEEQLSAESAAFDPGPPSLAPETMAAASPTFEERSEPPSATAPAEEEFVVAAVSAETAAVEPWDAGDDELSFALEQLSARPVEQTDAAKVEQGTVLAEPLQVTVAEAAGWLCEVTRAAERVLGKSVVTNYWRETQPAGLQVFKAERGGVSHSGDGAARLGEAELSELRRWVAEFMQRSERIVINIRDEICRGVDQGPRASLGLDAVKERT